MKINSIQLLKVHQIFKLRLFIISGIDTAAEEINGGIEKTAIGHDTVYSTFRILFNHFKIPVCYPLLLKLNKYERSKCSCRKYVLSSLCLAFEAVKSVGRCYKWLIHVKIAEYYLLTPEIAISVGGYVSGSNKEHSKPKFKIVTGLLYLWTI